jgi:hypothetical protein
MMAARGLRDEVAGGQHGDGEEDAAGGASSEKSRSELGAAAPCSGHYPLSGPGNSAYSVGARGAEPTV